MSLSRYAPRRIRAHYLRALKTLPLPAPQPEPVDPKHLTVLGRAWVDRRRLVFGTLTEAPRLWVAFSGAATATGLGTGTATATGLNTGGDTGTAPAMLGYFTGLATGEPDLWVCDDAHRAWTLTGENTAHLKRAAARVWFDCQRNCEG